MLATMDGTQTQITHQLLTDVNTASRDALPEDGASAALAARPASTGAQSGAVAAMRTLDQLGKGEQAIVAAINPSLAFGTLDALVTRRLWELGFLPGALISVVGFGLLNRDPVAVKIGGTKFALRRAEAQKVLVTSTLVDVERAAKAALVDVERAAKAALVDVERAAKAALVTSKSDTSNQKTVAQ